MSPGTCGAESDPRRKTKCFPHYNRLYLFALLYRTRSCGGHLCL